MVYYPFFEGGKDFKIPVAYIGRAIHNLGNTGSASTNINYFSVATTGNAISFGNLLGTRVQNGACASASRGIFAGGSGPVATMEFVTIQTLGNGTSFGNLTQARLRFGGGNDDTRGVFLGGYITTETDTNQNTIDFVTIATTGNATTFGTLITARGQLSVAMSTTRILAANGASNPSGNLLQSIEYITTATTGNAINFGSTTSPNRLRAGCSSNTRAVFAGGIFTNNIDYVTTATTGNAINFGNLTSSRGTYQGATSNRTRGVWSGGFTGSIVSTMDFVTIATTGNASNFGSLTAGSTDGASTSDSNGGLTP